MLTMVFIDNLLLIKPKMLMALCYFKSHDVNIYIQ